MRDEARPARFFVYGLLKPGFPLHHVVAPFVVRAEPATAAGALYDAGVPAAVFGRSGTIDGFVLHVTGARLAEAEHVLDDVEDEGEAYRRVTIRVSARAGDIDAQAYEWLGDVDGLPAVGREWPARPVGPEGP